MYPISLGNVSSQIQNHDPIQDRRTLYITPLEYATPRDKFFEAPNAVTGGVIYTVIYGTLADTRCEVCLCTVSYQYPIHAILA